MFDVHELAVLFGLTVVLGFAFGLGFHLAGKIFWGSVGTIGDGEKKDISEHPLFG